MASNFTRRDVLAQGARVSAGAGIAAGTLALSAARGLAAPAVGQDKNRDGNRPNVLFIPIDDMNDWNGWLGGYPGVKTPNLDRLAKLLTGFRSAYTPSPACQSARAAILFGIEPWRTGVYTNKTGNWTSTMLNDRPSIVRWFKDAGYETIGTGKVFHNGWRGNGDEIAENDPKAWSSYHFDGGENGKERLEWGPSGKSTSESEDVVRARWLVKNVLSKRHDKPFFAALGIRKPHMPWIVPQEWFERYPIEKIRYPLGALDVEHSHVKGNEDDKDLPEMGKEMIRQHADDHRKILAGKGWKSAVQAYLAAVSLADQAVGVVLDGLLSGPNAQNTIICVWSDHGWQLGEKLAWRKFTLWERATHVPLLIGGEGLRSGVSDALISSIDLYPTLARLATGDAPKNLDGTSFHKMLRNGVGEPRDHVLSTWALDPEERREAGEDKHYAVRTRTHRLIAYANGDRELYDHRDDPWEWNNLYRKSDDRQAALVEDLEKYLPKHSVPDAPSDGHQETD